MSGLFVRGDLVLLDDGGLQPAGVEVADGTVAAITTGAAASPTAPAGIPAGAEVLQVPPGVLVLPAMVDTHVHVNEPGRTDWEGFAHATAGAARGGFGTVVDMPLNSVPSTVDLAALRAKRSCADGAVFVDVGFWGGAVPGNLGDLRPLWDAGVYGFKCFLLDSGVDEFQPLDPEQLLAAMRMVGGFGGLMIVHAEDPAVVGRAEAPPSAAFADFVRSRPENAEVLAVQHVVEAVRETGTRAHILHLSSALAVETIAAAKAEGLPLTVETCPHYLVFDAASVPDGGVEWKCCPPIRDLGNQKGLWDALADGVIDAVVSDHCPTTPEMKYRGHGDFQVAWGGIAGLQLSFQVFAAAAREHGLPVEQVAALMSTNPARLAGLTGKGSIAVGMDADLTLYDPSSSLVVDQQSLAHRHKISPYHGRFLQGAVVRTVVRGQTVFDGTDVIGPAGRLLRRGD